MDLAGMMVQAELGTCTVARETSRGAGASARTVRNDRSALLARGGLVWLSN
jgi:hypothetical protein